MNDIRDALRKAGLVGKQDEKRFKHEERVRKKKLGRDGREAEKEQRKDDTRKRQAEQKASMQSAQKIRDEEVHRHQRERKLLADLESRALRAYAGPRRFHYRDRTHHLPYLGVSPEVSRRLEAGEYAIVEAPGTGTVLVVPREVAKELSRSHRDHVLHLPGL